MDPDYALAFSGLADAYYTNSLIYTGSKEDLHRAEMNAKKAIEIDNTLPEAHYATANIYLIRDWDLDRSERAIKKAL